MINPQIYISRYNLSPLLHSFISKGLLGIFPVTKARIFTVIFLSSCLCPHSVTHWFYFCALSPICSSSPLFCILIILNLRPCLLCSVSIVGASTSFSLPPLSLLSSSLPRVYTTTRLFFLNCSFGHIVALSKFFNILYCQQNKVQTQKQKIKRTSSIWPQSIFVILILND